MTIPFWVYDHTPAAVIEVMMADLPRVEYINDDKKITDDDVKKAEEKARKIAMRTKGNGLGIKVPHRTDGKLNIQSGGHTIGQFLNRINKGK